MELKNFFVQDLAGNAIPGAIGRLYDEGTTTLAGGLEDKDGNPQGNPMQANAIGQLQFAAPDGRYDLYISSAARNYTIRVEFFDTSKPVQAVSLLDYGVVGDGVADDSAAIQAWLSALASKGLTGFVPPGTYGMKFGTSTQLSESFAVECSPNAEFVALAGFPSLGAKMIGIASGAKANRTFKWVGGRFNSFNQPYDVAYANDTFSVNATNCSRCHVELDRVYSGDDWLNSGSDSHLFIGGPSSIFARIYDSIGARDTGIYISRNFAGTVGQFADVDGNFTKCNGAVIVKRRFESGRFHATAVDCVTGVSTGTADISGFATANAGHGFEVGVNAKRVEHPLFLNAATCVQGFVNAEQMGVSIPGYVSPSSSAVRFRGSSGCQISVNAIGVNPAITATVDFVGAFFGPITTALDGVLNATDNLVSLNCSGLGTPFFESGSGTNNNTIVGKIDAMLTNFSTIVGANTKYLLQSANIRYKFCEDRYINAAGQSLTTINADGSIGIGPRGTGSTNTAYVDWFSGTGTNRTARDLVTGGTGSVDTGTRTFQAGAFVFTGASADFSGVPRPVTDNSQSFGQLAKRWVDGFFVRIRPGAGTAIWTSGAGTPEAVVTAPVGSLFTRTDGGAATTLYVKETGAGNTGWVAK